MNKRKDSKKQLSSSKSEDGEIGSPYAFQHKAHVDSSLQWSINDPTKTFDLVEQIGEGSFGVVFKSVHKDTGSTVAIKIITLEDADKENEQISKEVELLKSCKHHNIVNYLGSCWNGNELWILMDYCSMGSLSTLLDSEMTLSEKQICYTLHCTLKGLEYLHQQQIIHRDIKPDNILLSERGEIKLADFGVSHRLSSTMFHGEDVVGTPLYIAPEVIKHKVYSVKLDIWAVGIMGIELADGVPPLWDMHPIRAMYQIPVRDPPTVMNAANFSKEFINFLEKCLQKDPAQRASSTTLLSDPFVVKSKGADVVRPLIDAAKEKLRKETQSKNKKSFVSIKTKIKSSFKATKEQLKHKLIERSSSKTEVPSIVPLKEEETVNTVVVHEIAWNRVDKDVQTPAEWILDDESIHKSLRNLQRMIGVLAVFIILLFLYEIYRLYS